MKAKVTMTIMDREVLTEIRTFEVIILLILCIVPGIIWLVILGLGRLTYYICYGIKNLFNRKR